MNFVERIKENLADQKSSRGYGYNKCLVNRKELEELLYHFERFDNEKREEYRKQAIERGEIIT